MIKRLRTKVIAGGIALSLMAGTAFAQHAGKGNGNGRDDDEDRSSLSRGGQLRALTSEEARELIAGIARFVDQSDAGLKWTTLPSGGIAIDLDDRFQSVTLARLATDGSVQMRCVGTAGEGAHFLATHAALAARSQPAMSTVTRGIDTSRLTAARRPAGNAIALEEK